MLPRPTRFGHVLRRLLAGKTNAINNRVAQRLFRDGLIECIEPLNSAATIRVSLTEKGFIAAKLAAKGVRLYSEEGLPQHPAVK